MIKDRFFKDLSSLRRYVDKQLFPFDKTPGLTQQAASDRNKFLRANGAICSNETHSEMNFFHSSSLSCRMSHGVIIIGFYKLTERSYGV